MKQHTEVEQGNRLIAEFMGYKLIQHKTLKYKYWEKEFSDGDIHTLSSEDKLKYHSLWDWLMPVVEKVEGLGYTFKICRRRVEIDVDGEFNIYPKVLSKQKTKIESVWIAVVEFIKWYNQTKKQIE